MSSARRRANRRDDNEPEIRKRFAAHGWHTETLSAPGMPDLLALATEIGPLLSAALVDVKGVKGKPTPAQVEKWTALAAAGIPVYVCRTRADVDALVAGTLEAWEPDTREVDAFARRLSSGTVRAPQPHGRRVAAGRDTYAEMSAAFETDVAEWNAARKGSEEEARIRSEMAKATYMRKLAEAEEALIPERARAELKRRGE